MPFPEGPCGIVMVFCWVTTVAFHMLLIWSFGVTNWVANLYPVSVYCSHALIVFSTHGAWHRNLMETCVDCGVAIGFCALSFSILDKPLRHIIPTQWQLCFLVVAVAMLCVAAGEGNVDMYSKLGGLLLCSFAVPALAPGCMGATL